MKPENKNTLTTIVEKGEIVLYQPDESIRLEVRIEDETVWLATEHIKIFHHQINPQYYLLSL